MSKKANQAYVEERLNQTMDKAGLFNGNGTLDNATIVNHWYEIKLAQGVAGLPAGIATRYNNSALYVFGQNSDTFTQMLFCGNGNDVYMRKYVGWFSPQWTSWAPLATTESGTWSPKLIDSNGNAAILDASKTYGNWAKVGNVMHVTATVKLTSKGALVPTAWLRISGLPLAAKPSYQGGTLGYCAGLNLTAAVYVETSGSNIDLHKQVSGGANRILASDLTDTAVFESINVTYLI